jgi:hypothetical protein
MLMLISLSILGPFLSAQRGAVLPRAELAASVWDR